RSRRMFSYCSMFYAIPAGHSTAPRALAHLVQDGRAVSVTCRRCHHSETLYTATLIERLGSGSSSRPGAAAALHRVPRSGNGDGVGVGAVIRAPASGCTSDSGVHPAHTSVSVPLYRCYFLDHRRYVVDHRIVTCETDDAARTVADTLLRENAYPVIE